MGTHTGEEDHRLLYPHTSRARKYSAFAARALPPTLVAFLTSPSHSCTASNSHSHGHGHGEKEENLNVRAAYLHAMGDLLQSFAVLCAGVIIWLAKKMHWSDYFQLADPCCTVVFACLVLWSSIGVMKRYAFLITPSPLHPPQSCEALITHHAYNPSCYLNSIANVLLEGVPEGMDATEIFATLRRELRPRELGAVRKVSHLHLW